jgi:hypothetical protein
MNLVRAVSSEGFGRIRYHTMLRRRLDTDPELAPFFDGETTDLPAFYRDRIKQDLGPLWSYLPPESLMHDANAYLKSSPQPVRLAVAGKAAAR